MSLDTPFVPFKKTILVFSMYIKLLLGEEIKEPNTNCYLSPEIVENMYEKKARILIEKPNAVELFYVSQYILFLTEQRKYILKTNENPLPQTLVVGGFRALLATCPQNAKKPSKFKLNFVNVARCS